MYNEFLTLDGLATFVGLVAAVMLIVQFLKPIVKDHFNDIIVRVFTFVIALILIFVFASAGTGVKNIILNILNAIVISMASMGGYEIIADPRAEKHK